jgi:4'-phosphopantetheinyl transferase
MPEPAIELLVARLDVGPAALREAHAVLSEDERQRAGRILLARERRRFTAARALLRRLLGERLGVPAAAVELTYGRRGKPELGGVHADAGLHFNLSHRDGIAAYALARGRALGVDVETVRALPEADDIARRAFSARECAAYFALEARERPLAFFNCWTRKEAFVKALGEGLSHGLGGFDVSLAPGEPARILRVDGTPIERCGWVLHAFTPAPGMTGAVVARAGDARPDRIVLCTKSQHELAAA